MGAISSERVKSVNDVTPSELVAGLITEHGIVPSTSAGIRHKFCVIRRVALNSTRDI